MENSTDFPSIQGKNRVELLLPLRSELLTEHYREIVGGSGVAPEFVEGRYLSVTTEQARTLGFSEVQAGEGWAVKLTSPTGEISYQLKRKHPRRDKNGDIIKYETRAGHDIVIDVHPRNHSRLRDVNVPIVVPEGTKKGDFLASLGYLSITLTGVWNWGRKRKVGGAKYGRPELLDDWNDVPVEGRDITILFDRDWREKQNVALAMLRLAERLTERGAHVYIASLPGPEKGIDDYGVAGGDVEAILRDARPFRASDLIPFAAKQDKRIWAVLGAVREAMRTDELAATTHSLLRALCELALLGGRYDKERDAVELVIGTRDLRLYAGIGSLATLARHTAILEDEERGYIDVERGDHKKGKANRYILKSHKSVSLIERGSEVSRDSITDTDLWDFVPHLRWPAPSPSDRGLKDTPGRQSRPTAPGSSDRAPMKASGKSAEMALSLLVLWGDSPTLRDLCRAMRIRDTCRLRDALFDFAEAGIVGMEPKGKHRARVWLEEGWERRLDERQEVAGELARARQQAVKLRKSRQAFADDVQADKAPEEGEMMGPEKVQEVIEEHKETWRAEEAKGAAAERERAENFITGMMAKPHIRERGCIRYGLLLDMWRGDHGGTEWHFRRAMNSLKLTVKRHAEHQGEMFIYASDAGGEDGVAV